MPATNTLTSIFTAIANAIRGKNGLQTQYRPDEMAAAITNLPSGGDGNIVAEFGGGQQFTSVGYFIARSIKKIDISDWVVDRTWNKNTMANAFRGLSKLNEIKWPDLSVALFTTLQATFYGCESIVSIDLSNVNTSKVASTADMCSWCTALKSINLANYPLSALTNINNMFYYCSSLEAIIWSQEPTVQPIPTAPTSSIIPTGALVYVPNSLYEDYIIESNWSTIATQLRPISALPQEYKTLYNIS